MSNNTKCLLSQSPTTYWLLGPITTGQNFYLAYTVNKVVYILSYFPGNGDNSLAFTPSNLNPLNLTAAQNGAGFTISFINENQVVTYLATNSNNLIVPSPTAQILELNALSFNNFDFMLTGVKYIFNNTSGSQVLWNTYVPANNATFVSGFTTQINSAIQTLQTSVYALPLNIFPCQDCNVSFAPTTSVLLEGCWESQDYTACTSLNKSSYFSNSNDCLTGIWYQYCAPNVFCGNTACRGPCTSGNECLFNGSTSTFQCQNGPAPISDTWIVILVVGLILLFFLVIIFIVGYRRYY